MTLFNKQNHPKLWKDSQLSWKKRDANSIFLVLVNSLGNKLNKCFEAAAGTLRTFSVVYSTREYTYNCKNILTMTPAHVKWR